MLLIAILAALALIGRVGQHAHGCGLTTHIEIAERALFASNETLTKIAWEHRGAVQAGSVFPDIFFVPCGGNHGLGEDIHWTPFLKTAVEYTREKYGADETKWSKDAKELIAFILGIASHQVADALWHNLGVDQGFIQAMADVNFHSQFAPSHNTADNLDDALLLYEMNPDHRIKGPLGIQIGVGKWEVPVSDLLNIFKLFTDIKVSQLTLVSCINLQYSLRTLESLLLAGVFKTTLNDIAFAATASHFLTSNFYDYHVGGFHSMAEASIQIWSDLGVWFKKGSSYCSLDHNPLYINCAGSKYLRSSSEVANISSQRRQACMHKYYQLLNKWSKIATVDELVTSSIDENGRLTLTTTANVQALLENGAIFDLQDNPSLLIKIDPTPTYDHESAEPDVVGEIRTIQSVQSKALAAELSTILGLYTHSKYIILRGDNQYDECGSAVVTGVGRFGEGTNLEIYAVGCAGSDSVKINIEKPGYEPETIRLYGPNRFERFGSSLALVDLNKDGYLDLAVGAPLSRNGGTVYVYFGSKYGLTHQPGLIILGKLENTVSWVIGKIAGLGYGLESGDLDGDGYLDLIVTAPYSNEGFAQSGSVFVFFSSQKLTSNRGAFEAASLAGWSAHGSMPSAWFGKFARVAKLDSKKRKLLLVSAPYTRHCESSCTTFSESDKESVGAIYGYVFEGTDSTKSFVLLGTSQNDKLEAADVAFIEGHSEDEFILAVSSDTTTFSSLCRQCGRVLLFKLYDLLDHGITRLETLTPIAEFKGGQTASRFGYSLRFIGPDLYVVSPFYGVGLLTEKQTPLLSRISYEKGKWIKKDTKISVPGRLTDVIALNDEEILVTIPYSTLDRIDQGLVLQLPVEKIK